MALDPTANFAFSTIATAPSPADTGTSLVIATGDGALFPDPSSDGAYNVIVKPAGTPPTVDNAEILRVTAVSTDTFTVTREQEGTSARSIGIGDQIYLSPTALTITSIQQALYPIGSIYINAAVSTNPGTLLGFGTWSAFGAGRVPVGFDSGDSDFDTVEETGGAKTHTLTTSQMPTHSHTQNSHDHSNPANRLGSNVGNGGSFAPSAQNMIGDKADAQFGNRNSSTGSTTATNQNSGSGGSHNNLQPYIVVYMWKRTA